MGYRRRPFSCRVTSSPLRSGESAGELTGGPVNNELTGSGTDLLIDALLDSPDMQIFLQRLVTISAIELAQVAGEAHCSVTVWRQRRPLTICSSDPETAAMDEVQYGSKQGP